MKKFLIIFLLIFSYSFSGKVITLATDPFPPFHSPDVPNYGFFAEIVAEAFKVSGYTLKIEFMPWSRALALAEKGTYDGIIGVSFNEERAKVFNYSNVVYNSKASIYAKESAVFKKDDIINLKGLKLGKVRDYYYPNEKSILKNFTIIESSSAETNVGALINERVDIIIGTEPVVDNLLNTTFAKEKNNIVKCKSVYSENFSIMISKKINNSEKLVEEFNEGLKKIKENGIYNKILKKYEQKEKVKVISN